MAGSSRRDRGAAAPTPKGGGGGGLRGWLSAKRAVLQFVGLFALLMALFYGVFYRPPVPGVESRSDRVINAYLARYASAAGGFLRMAAGSTAVSGYGN